MIEREHEFEGRCRNIRATCIIDEPRTLYYTYSTTVYSRIGGHGWRNVYYCRIPNAVLIRECVRIVKKQCITSDNKQIGAGRGKEKLCIIRGFKLGGIKEGSFSGTTLYYFLFSRYFPDTPPRLNFLSFFSRRNKIIFSTILDRNVILSKRECYIIKLLPFEFLQIFISKLRVQEHMRSIASQEQLCSVMHISTNF